MFKILSTLAGIISLAFSRSVDNVDCENIETLTPDEIWHVQENIFTKCNNFDLPTISDIVSRDNHRDPSIVKKMVKLLMGFPDITLKDKILYFGTWKNFDFRQSEWDVVTETMLLEANDHLELWEEIFKMFVKNQEDSMFLKMSYESLKPCTNDIFPICMPVSYFERSGFPDDLMKTIFVTAWAQIPETRQKILYNIFNGISSENEVDIDLNLASNFLHVLPPSVRSKVINGSPLRPSGHTVLLGALQRLDVEWNVPENFFLMATSYTKNVANMIEIYSPETATNVSAVIDEVLAGTRTFDQERNALLKDILRALVKERLCLMSMNVLESIHVSTFTPEILKSLSGCFTKGQMRAVAEHLCKVNQDNFPALPTEYVSAMFISTFRSFVVKSMLSGTFFLPRNQVLEASQEKVLGEMLKTALMNRDQKIWEQILRYPNTKAIVGNYDEQTIDELVDASAPFFRTNPGLVTNLPRKWILKIENLSGHAKSSVQKCHEVNENHERALEVQFARIWRELEYSNDALNEIENLICIAENMTSQSRPEHLINKIRMLKEFSLKVPNEDHVESCRYPICCKKFDHLLDRPREAERLLINRFG